MWLSVPFLQSSQLVNGLLIKTGGGGEGTSTVPATSSGDGGETKGKPLWSVVGFAVGLAYGCYTFGFYFAFGLVFVLLNTSTLFHGIAAGFLFGFGNFDTQHDAQPKAEDPPQAVSTEEDTTFRYACKVSADPPSARPQCNCKSSRTQSLLDWEGGSEDAQP